MRFAVKALITVAIVWVLLASLDLDQILIHVLGVDLGYSLIAVGLGLLLALVASLRWYFVIEAMGQHLSWPKTLQLTMIGTFFNQILPTAMGGDLARIPYANKFGLPIGLAVNSVVVDRLTAFAALILLVLVCAPITYNAIPEPQARWTLSAVALSGVAAIALILSAERMPGLMSSHIALKQILNLSGFLREALFGRYSVPIFLYGTTVHLLRVLTVYVIAVGMTLEVSFFETLVLVPPALLVTALPISVGGWGVREGAFVIAFGFVAIPPEQAFALSVIFGVTTMIAALFGGPFWIFVRQQRTANP